MTSSVMLPSSHWRVRVGKLEPHQTQVTGFGHLHPSKNALRLVWLETQATSIGILGEFWDICVSNYFSHGLLSPYKERKQEIATLTLVTFLQMLSFEADIILSKRTDQKP